MTMVTKWSLLALGLGVYLAVAIVSFPASIAYRWFFPDEVVLAAVDGTIWRGQAAHGAAAGLAFSNLSWELYPSALLTGRVRLVADAELATGFANAEVTAAGNRVILSNVRAATNLATFRDLLTLGDVSGQVNVALDRLELADGWPVDASGEIRIGNLTIPPLLPTPGVATVMLGNYRAQLSPSDAPGVSALLSDQGGPIELTGRLSLEPDGRYSIDALLKTRADAPSYLVQGIELMTEPPNSNGQRRFALSGML